MKPAKRQRRRKHRSQMNEAMHLRVSEQDKVDLWAIAQRENRDLSETMRNLLKLGVASYWVTGTLIVVDVKATEEPADELGKEQQHLIDAFSHFSRALDKFNTRMQSLFKKDKTQERRDGWQQAQNR